MWGNWVYHSGLAGVISFCLGFVARCPLPVFCRAWLFGRFSAVFGLNLAEVGAPLTSYSSFDQFFTRSLCFDSRSIDEDSGTVVCPVDGVLLASGVISGDRVIQVKGVDYSLSSLLGPLFSETYRDGYFLTWYLSPKDCHRIFSPVAGEVSRACWIPGKLFPVREPYISGLPGLYVKNERVISELKMASGSCAVVKVGAFNVGRISLPYDPGFVTHRFESHYQLKSYPNRPTIEKCGWLGTFHLGSTVVVVFEKDRFKSDVLALGQQYSYGQRIGCMT